MAGCILAACRSADAIGCAALPDAGPHDQGRLESRPAGYARHAASDRGGRSFATELERDPSKRGAAAAPRDAY